MRYTAPRKPTPGVLRAPGAILLMSCYELGHQPLGLAWPKAFLERAGYAPATIDLAVEALDESTLRQARLIAIAVPMHTALRLGVRAAERIRRVNPACRIVFHGLYALLNTAYLLDHVADAVLGGETEVELVGLVQRLEAGTEPSPQRQAVLGRLNFPIPSRAGLPALTRYVSLVDRGRVVPAGYVEASRGCLHRCLHCPIPPVYEGRFFAVPHEVVLEDVRGLVQAGVEHILEQEAIVPQFAATGCLFVVSALESLADVVLANLEKGHTRADILVALDVVRRAGIALRPSFVPFTPWSTLDDYLDLLDFVEAERLIDHVDPVQYTIRLLIPPGSLLLSRPAIRPFLGALDPAAFTYRWTHPDPRMDELQRAASALVERAAGSSEDVWTTFYRLRALAAERAGLAAATGGIELPPPERPIPARLTEPWFC